MEYKKIPEPLKDAEVYSTSSTIEEGLVDGKLSHQCRFRNGFRNGKKRLNKALNAPVTVRQILIFAVIAFTSYSILCALQSKFYFARHPIECIERWIVKTYNEYFNKPEEKVIPVQFRGWYNSRGNYKPGDEYQKLREDYGPALRSEFHKMHDARGYGQDIVH